MPKRLVLLLATAALAVNAVAVETKFWRQDDQSDFEKGSLKSLSLRSDGRLTLAPALSEIFDASTPYLWAIARDSKGNLYLGGGGSDSSAARLYKVDAAGKSSTVADLPGLAIQAIAVDGSDHVFAATSPDGKVYEMSGGKPSVFFEPKAKYIWAIAFHGSDLFVATGDPGQIFRVSPDGRSSLFFKTEETHARSLAIDADGNLVVGTDPGGLVIRVSSSGQGFVLYQTPKSEVAALAVAPNGDIYAAALGSKGSAPVPSPAPSMVAITPSRSPEVPGTAIHSEPAFPPASHIAPPTAGGSEVFRIERDGSTRRVWSDGQALVYAIAFDASGRALLGTGNRGIIYRIDSPVLSTRLMDLAPTQITAFCSSPDGSLYAITGNVGKIYRIGPGTASEGTFESDTLDSGWFSRWGRLSLNRETSGVSVWTRSGNLDRPQQDWSEWQPVSITDGSGIVTSPAARFLQYKLALRGAVGEVSSVNIAYLPKNVAPEIQEVEITPPNYRFPPPLGVSAGNQQNISLPPLGAHPRTGNTIQLEVGSSSSMSYAKGYIGARWNATDDNADTLIYKLEIRGAKETVWRPLKDKIREKSFSWDSSAFPDGVYRIRVTASDEGSNPASEALTTSLISDSFVIDNTPPQITDATPGPPVRWRAHDALSIIGKAEYSIDGGEWQAVDPVNKLSDSRDEEYSLSPGVLAAGEHVVAIRVTDDYDNQSVAQVVIH